jgi:hypothetical protein
MYTLNIDFDIIVKSVQSKSNCGATISYQCLGTILIGKSHGCTGNSSSYNCLDLGFGRCHRPMVRSWMCSPFHKDSMTIAGVSARFDRGNHFRRQIAGQEEEERTLARTVQRFQKHPN